MYGQGSFAVSHILAETIDTNIGPHPAACTEPEMRTSPSQSHGDKALAVVCEVESIIMTTMSRSASPESYPLASTRRTPVARSSGEGLSRPSHWTIPRVADMATPLQ